MQKTALGWTSLRSACVGGVTRLRRDNWSEEELSAAVDSYLRMLELDTSGESYTKKHIYEKLAKEYGRTVKSYEFRMQNISYIYASQGRNWVKGLKPAKNIGARVANTLQKIIAKKEGQVLATDVGFETEVVSYVNKSIKQPVGIKEPKSQYTNVSTFERDPKVKAWVLENANGVCECCESKAPFVSTGGVPYLEVHHIKRLADRGSDTITNAIAVCPNCHRELHYGQNKSVLINKLYENIARLVRE